MDLHLWFKGTAGKKFLIFSGRLKPILQPIKRLYCFPVCYVFIFIVVVLFCFSFRLFLLDILDSFFYLCIIMPFLFPSPVIVTRSAAAAVKWATVEFESHLRLSLTHIKLWIAPQIQIQTISGIADVHLAPARVVNTFLPITISSALACSCSFYSLSPVAVFIRADKSPTAHITITRLVVAPLQEVCLC